MLLTTLSTEGRESFKLQEDDMRIFIVSRTNNMKMMNETTI